MTEDNSLKRKPGQNKKTKVIIQYDLNGNAIAEFLGANSAAESISACPFGILECCHGKSFQYKGYIWLYAKDADKLPEYIKANNQDIENMPNEEWRDIAGFEGAYQISNMGRVKSLRRQTHKSVAILNPGQIKRGYLFVMLYANGIRQQMLVHRLVAQEFIPNPNNLPFVNHKDENSQNNCAENLEWCDYLYNANYGTRNARVSKSISHPVSQFSKSGEFIKTFPSMIEAARECGINHTNLVRAANGDRKTCGGYVWRKVEHKRRNRKC